MPCPSAHAPQQNLHRKMDGWQHSAVVAILENPRYTGYAIYGRWQKVEELLDPEDVATGYVARFRRSPLAKIVRSREPAHPAIVSVETFTAAQLEKRRGGLVGWRSGRRGVGNGLRRSGHTSFVGGSGVGSVSGRWRERPGTRR
ncbi:hypothetical protein G3I17_03620 [Streptomyces sp. SID13031]|nr:hypothetical protein [Streptomyces sp. SID13031]